MDRPETPPTLPAGTVVDDYVIEERIGFGGFGEVFRARHSVIDRKVALKILHAKYSSDAEALARFVEEARSVTRISHPGIVDVFTFGEVVGRAYLGMELIEGELLRDLLRERGRLPLAEALPILRGIAEAVDAAHVAGIAHRDLKPDNVFVLAGRTKLIDFGLAKLVRHEPVTQTGSIFGTPLYMSPEQCRGGKIDTRTDLYSFGALAYHVLVGEPPFGGDPIELALHHVNDRPTQPSKRCRELSRNVDRVLLALLAKDPAERPVSLVAAVDALAGASRLRVRSKRLKYVALAAIPVGLAAFGISKVTTRDAPTVAAEVECGAASAKVAPIWNPATRDAIGTRFVSDRADIQRAWKLTGDGLDKAVIRWSSQWDQACHAPDPEPLLHAQRIACLETALASLRNWVDALQKTNVVAYSEGQPGYVDFGTGRRGLADCANTAVLRAQVPPPPKIMRPFIAASQGSVELTIERGWAAYTKRDVPGADRAIAELDRLARKIEKRDPASASDAILARLDLMIAVAWDKDLHRLPAAREAVDDAIKRIEASRDDVALAHAYILLAGIERASLHSPVAIKRAFAALDRADQAVTRAGKPIYAVIALHQARGELAAARGKFADAAGSFREALRLAIEVETDPTSHEMALIAVLARGEQPKHAALAARVALQRIVERFGRESAQISWPYGVLSNVHEILGEHEDADTARRHAVELYARSTTSPPDRKTWSRAYLVEAAFRRGKADPQEGSSLLRDLAKLGTVPPHHNPDGIATARRAGLFEAFAFGAERNDVTGEDEQHDHLATLAFHRGDLATMKQHAAVSVTSCAAVDCKSWIRFSLWLAVLADGKDVDSRLDRLERDYAIPSAFAYSGIVLAKLGRWKDALVKLEAARAEPAKWEMQADLTELDTWLGLARLEAGDTLGARAAFEEALRAISFDRNGIEGFSYMTPVAQLALAKILWDAPDGDRHRARKLAERARDGFDRLGPHRVPDRDRAARWLAEHQ